MQPADMLVTGYKAAVAQILGPLYNVKVCSDSAEY